MGGDERAALLRLAPSLLVLVAPTLPTLQLYVLSVPCCADPSYSTSYLFFLVHAVCLLYLPIPYCLPLLSPCSTFLSVLPRWISVYPAMMSVPHWSIWVPRCRVWPIPSSHSYLHVCDDIFQFPIPASPGRSLPNFQFHIPASSGRSLPACNLVSAHCAFSRCQASVLPPAALYPPSELVVPQGRCVSVSFIRLSSRRYSCSPVSTAAVQAPFPSPSKPAVPQGRCVVVSFIRLSSTRRPILPIGPAAVAQFVHRPTDRCGRRPFQIAVPVLPVPYLCVPTMDESPR